MASGSKSSKDEFYDDDKKAVVGGKAVRVFGSDSQRMRKELHAGKDIVNDTKIDVTYFKKD